MYVGLKKVTDDMKTHKNPSLRQGPKPFAPSPTSSPKPFAKVSAPGVKSSPVRPPKFELEGKKWLVVSKILILSLYFLYRPIVISFTI